MLRHINCIKNTCVLLLDYYYYFYYYCWQWDARHSLWLIKTRKPYIFNVTTPQRATNKTIRMHARHSIIHLTCFFFCPGRSALLVPFGYGLCRVEALARVLNVHMLSVGWWNDIYNIMCRFYLFNSNKIDVQQNDSNWINDLWNLWLQVNDSILTSYTNGQNSNEWITFGSPLWYR